MDITIVFMKIVNMSLMAGYCIGVILILRFLLQRQPKILSYLLWSVVLFRLLCPFSVTSSYSLLRMDTAVVSRENFAGTGKKDAIVWRKGYFSSDEVAQGIEAVATEAVSVSPLQDAGAWEQATGWQRAILIGAWVWLAGIAVLLGYSLWSAFRFRRFLAKAVSVSEDCCEAEGISTPFVFGIIHPKIYLPTHLKPEERQYVLEHERVHLARRDYLVKLISWGAVCLHWFNPLVWISFVLMERDMEMSCDEAVIRRLGADEKQAYSLTLLQLSCEGRGWNGSPIAFGEGNVKGRIQNVLGWHKRKLVTMASLALLLGILIFGLALNPAKQEKDEAEEMLQMGFVDAYATAYCDRQGDELVSFYIDEETAFEHVMELDKVGGSYTFGISSPWPNEFRFVLDEETGEDGGKAQIWYYAWTSDPHVSVWKEEIHFTDFHVTDSSFKFLDNISSREEFEEAYLIDGEYRFTDYVERGFLEGINVQAAYDRENGDADRNAVYRSPDTAAAWILNLEGGQSEILSNISGQQAEVAYTFSDGSRVEIPMYNANYEKTTVASNEADVKTERIEEVWLLDLRLWNEKAL